MFDDFGKLLAEGGKGILEFLGPAAFFIIYAVISVVNAKKKKSNKDGRREIDEATRRHVNERLKGKQPGVARPVRREEVPVTALERRSVPASGRNLPYAKRYQQKQTEKAQRRAEHQQQLEAKRILERSRREQKVVRRDPVLLAHQDPGSQRDRSDVRVPVPQVKRAAVRGTAAAMVRDVRPRPKHTTQVKPSKVAPEPARETIVETAAASGNILASLYEQDTLKRAIVYAEILGKPVGLREGEVM